MSESEEEDGPVVSLTGFLFGNVDTKTGKLEDASIFGTDSDKQIKALENLGLGLGADLTDEDDGVQDEDGVEGSEGSGLDGEKKRDQKKKKTKYSYDSSDDSDDSDDSDENDSDEDDVDPDTEPVPKKSASSGSKGGESKEKEDYDDIKSEQAVDFSDMNELIEEEAMVPVQLPSSMVPNFAVSGSMNDDYDDDYDTVEAAEKDKIMMPPPSLPGVSGAPSTSKPGTSSMAIGSGGERKLETPLAAMLPSKYEGVSVTTLFPDFRPDKVLRFSRLFGPGKYSSLPHVWKNVKKRRKKRKEKQDEQNLAASSSVTIPGLTTSASISATLLMPPPPPVPALVEPEVRTGHAYWDVSSGEPDISVCVPDEEEVYCRPHETVKEEDEETVKRKELGKRKEDKKFLWRQGPASIWYEMVGIPEEPDHPFDYGFKLRSPEKDDSDSQDSDNSDDEGRRKAAPLHTYADDCFNMVTQMDWEQNIIWDGQDAKMKKMSKNKAAGWVPSGSNRSAQNLGKQQEIIISPTQSPVRIGASAPLNSPTGTTATGSPSPASKSSKSAKASEEGGLSGGQGGDTWYSIFPVETTELVYGNWEKDIIWDVDNMDDLPEPKVLELDPNDENIILCIPEDIDPNASQNSSAPVKVKIPHPHVKKSKILLGKAGVINVIEEDSPPPSPKADDKDPYNISLDEYYQAKHTEQALIKISTSGNIIQHSTPVVELRAPFIPTHMNLQKLRNFHRPALRKLSSGPTSVPGPHTLLPLTRHIQRKAKQREAERLAAGGGDIFFMRTPEDFTGKDGEIIITEYCEEHPPLLNQVGMCSKLKNYYKRKAGKDVGPTDCKYGETVNAHTSPFLGAMHPGQMIQTIENNMYRSPIFPHEPSKTDFLVIRTRNNFFIRNIDAVFTAGQECPLYEVPGPNSKRANNFVRDFLQVFIYRLFWSSQDNPRRIRMDDIKRAFPMHSESSIRKRLKLCADFKRTGSDSNWWVIKPEFRLPTEEEIRSMVSPEQCCAYFSLIAAEQRLKDAGYGTQSILAPPPEDEDENEEKKLDDEVKVAPWNTTRAYIQAIKGKCILQINGPADPTGCGEGFSYVRMPNKPQTTVEEKETQPKRIVTGTDADLRRLSLNNAKALLRQFLVPEAEIQRLSRWEVIDVVRTLSTEKAKAGEEGMNKFSRGNRFSVAEHQERYKEECQRIFELQNRVLNSGEVLSTDEGESTEEEEDIEDIEEMGKNIEKMLSNKKTSSQLNHEKEEAERRELQRMIMGEGKDEKEEEKQPKKNKKNQEKIDEDNNNLQGLSMHPGRVLKIHRTFKTSDGKEFTRSETVRKSHIIDIYMRIRTTKDEAFIRQFALLDDQTKEEMKKEKRRIQEQLRRIKKNQEKEHVSRPPTQRKKKVKAKPELKMKCGACGQVGHMRTNKACPFYEKNNESVPSMNVAMTEEEEVEIEKELIVDDDENLVKIDGTKMQLSGKLFKQADEIKRRSLLLKVPKDAVAGPSKLKKKRGTNVEPHCDYLEGKSKSANRQRIDPMVVLSNILETIINDMRNEPDSAHFLFPVSQKIPRYYEIVKHPRDLQTIREKNREKRYQTRAEFLEDIRLMVDNCALYNGRNHQLTATAEKFYQMAELRLAENESKLSRLEKQINPLLDDNDKRKFAYMLNMIMDRIKVTPEALCFLKPVNKKAVKNYYEVIAKPMDLETMEKLINEEKYLSRQEFLNHIQLIYENANQYNGPDHSVTKRALYVLDFSKALMKEFEPTLITLEASLQEGKHSESMDEDDDGEDAASVGVNEDSNLEPDIRTTIDSNGEESSQYQANKVTNAPQVQMKPLLEVPANVDTMEKLPARNLKNCEDQSSKDTFLPFLQSVDAPSNEKVFAEFREILRKREEQSSTNSSAPMKSVELPTNEDPFALLRVRLSKMWEEPNPSSCSETSHVPTKSIEVPAKEEQPSSSTTASLAAKLLEAPINEKSSAKLPESAAGTTQKYEAQKEASSSLAPSTISMGEVAYPNPTRQCPLVMKSKTSSVPTKSTPAKEEQPSSSSTTSCPVAKSLEGPSNEESFGKLRQSVAGIMKKYEAQKRASSSLVPSAISTQKVSYPKSIPQQRPLVMKSLKVPAKEEKPTPLRTSSPVAKSLVVPKNQESFEKLRESVAGIIKKYKGQKKASSSLAPSTSSTAQGFHMSEDEDSGGPSAKRLRRNTEDEEQSGFSRRSRYSTDNDSRGQQEAIEAMLNLSKATPTLQNPYPYPSTSSDMEADSNTNIHMDLEVSDSNDEEEGEIVDEWD